VGDHDATAGLARRVPLGKGCRWQASCVGDVVDRMRQMVTLLVQLDRAGVLRGEPHRRGGVDANVGEP
jgi:hypothetical protein